MGIATIFQYGSFSSNFRIELSDHISFIDLDPGMVSVSNFFKFLDYVLIVVFFAIEKKENHRQAFELGKTLYVKTAWKKNLDNFSFFVRECAYICDDISISSKYKKYQFNY